MNSLISYFRSAKSPTTQMEEGELISSVNMKEMATACKKMPSIKAKLEAQRKAGATKEAIATKLTHAAEKRALLTAEKNLKTYERKKQIATKIKEREANSATTVAMKALRDDKKLFQALRRHA